MENTIGQRLELFLSQKNISNDEAAKRFGLPKQQISSWRLGKTNITTSYIPIILKSFPELNARWFLTGEGSIYNDADATDTNNNGISSHPQINNQVIDSTSKSGKTGNNLAKPQPPYKTPIHWDKTKCHEEIIRLSDEIKLLNDEISRYKCIIDEILRRPGRKEAPPEKYVEGGVERKTGSG